MRALADKAFDPTRPLQTDRGAQQALRCGHNKIDDLIKHGRLKTVYVGRLRRISTQSILEYAAKGDGPPTRGKSSIVAASTVTV
jgi:excisionase family DNA binding protein